MTILYTWIPKPVEAVEAGALPDLGHSALQVDDTYVSFWPEVDSVVGQVTSALKPRPYRNPRTYREESDPHAPFLQRAADYVDEISGAAAPPMLAAWKELHDAPYDFRTRNCSHVVRSVLRAGLTAATCEQLDRLQSQGEPKDAAGNPLEEVCRAIREVLAAPITGCTPEEVRAEVQELQREGVVDSEAR